MKRVLVLFLWLSSSLQDRAYGRQNTTRSRWKRFSYITVKVTDKNGNLCPHDRRLIKFSVKRNGSYRASVNGDPTSLDLFHLPQMHVFNGMLTTIVQAGEAAGKLTLEAKAFGIKSGKLEVTTK